MTQNAATRISKNTSALLAGTICRAGLTLAFVIYLARVAGVEKFGQYALARHYFELFLGLSSTSVGILITRRIARDVDCLGQCVTHAAVILSGLAAASTGILWALGHLFQYSDGTRLVICAAALSLLPAVLAAVLESAFVAIERAGVVTCATALSTLLFVVGGVLVIEQGHGMVAIFAALAASRIFMLLCYFVLLRRHVPSLRWRFDRSSFGEMIRELKFYALENWCSTLNNHLGLILLSIFHSEFVVGLFAAASKVMNVGNLLATSYTRAVFPYLARVARESADTFRRVSQGSVKYMLALVLPFIIMLSAYAEQVVTLLYGGSYSGAANVLRIMVWVVLVRFVNPFLSHALFARGEQAKSLRAAVIRLAVYCSLGFGLIPAFGAAGAAWATLGSTVAAFCIYYVSVFRDQGQGLGLAAPLARTMLAGLLSAWLLFAAGEENPVPMLLIGAVVYAALLVVFRVVTWNEIRFACRLRRDWAADGSPRRPAIGER